MAYIKGAASGIVVFVALILLVSAIGLVGTIELVICAVLAAAVGVLVTRNQLAARTRARPNPS